MGFQLLQTPPDTRCHGSGRHGENVGNFVVALLLEISQGNHLAVMRRQLVEGVFKTAAGVFGKRCHSRCIGGTNAFEQQAAVFAVNHQGSGAALAQEAHGFIMCDAIEPRCQGAVPVVAVQVHIGLDECILDNVFGMLGMGPEQAFDVALQYHFETADDLTIGAGVAKRPRNQAGVFTWLQTLQGHSFSRRLICTFTPPPGQIFRGAANYGMWRSQGASQLAAESSRVLVMKQYLDLMRHVRGQGFGKGDRTGIGTLSVFGYQMRFDLEQGFPLVTTKKLHLRSIIHELLWFIRGETNIQYLHDNKVRIWDEWADANGDLGPVYGAQWRSWPARDGSTIDQLAEVIARIRKSPDSRRLMVTAWNPADVDKMALPPCHCLFQFYVADGKLSCQLYQRSADIFLGVPFNIASYALLTHMVAQVTGLKPGEFIHTLGDAHLYRNHLDQADEQLQREPLPLPRLVIKRDVTAIDDFRFEDFEIAGYQSHPHIAAPVAV